MVAAVGDFHVGGGADLGRAEGGEHAFAAGDFRPWRLAEQVADDALAQEIEDAWIAEQVAAGHPVDGLFPLNAEWRARYEEAVSERSANDRSAR